MPNDLITLSSAPHPFQAATMTLPVAAGPTLEQMLEQVQADPVLRMHAVAFVDGHEIERQYWRGFRPKPGTLVEIRVRPTGGGGGGKDTLRTVLTLAVLVAAATIPGLQVLGLNATQQAFLQAGIAVVGNLAINALVPVQQPDGPPEAEKRLGIQGFQNRARPFDPVTQVLGRHRIAPDYGARVFTEIIGKDQYLRAIFVWGIGPLGIDVDSIRIGETPINNFEGVEMEHRQGFPDDAPRKLYSNTVSETNEQLFLGEQDNLNGPFVRTASSEADELSVDITMPGGLSGTGKGTGNFLSAQTIFTIEYRKVGTTTWLVPNYTAKTVQDSQVSGKTVDIWGKTKSAIRHGFRWDVPERGTYEVRVEMTGGRVSSNPRTNDTYWTALRAFLDEDPITSRVPIATTSVRIKATDQLNGMLDQLNGIVTTIGKDWNGTAWVDDQPITNPSSLYRHVLQGRANAVPLPDARTNLPNLEDFHDFCVAKDFTCATVITNGRSVWEVLSEVASCGRASPAEVDGQWGVVIDRPQAVPVSHITPRNSANFKSEKAFIELPHAFRIPFVNEEQNWRRDERRVYRTGFDASSATEFEELQLPGITNPDQVERMGRYRMAQGIQQPERFSFRQDMEFLTYQRGDRVKITHDVLLVGLHSGRIKDVVLDELDNVTGLVLDEEVEMDAGEDYGISIRTLDDPSLTRKVVTQAGRQNEITLDTSIPSVGGLPAVERHNIFGFGLFGQETDDAQIISIQPQNNAEANIVAVPYREVIYSGDDEAIPPFETNLTPLPAVPTPVVREIISDERTIVIDGTGNIRLRVAFNVDPVPASSEFAGAVLEVQQRAADLDEPEPFRNSVIEERDGGRVVVGGVSEDEVLDFRLRWVPTNGRLQGPWTTGLSHVVVGRTGGMSGPGITLIASTVTGNSGFSQRPIILMSWLAGEAPFGVEALSFEVRVTPSSELVARGAVDVLEGEHEIHDVLPDTAYEVRARYLMGALIVWSDWKAVTTPDVRLSSEDLVDDLNDKIDTAFDRHDGAVEDATGTIADLRESVQTALGRAVLNPENMPEGSFDSDLQSLTGRVGDAEAEISDEAVVRADEDSALAGTISSVSATFTGQLEGVANAQPSGRRNLLTHTDDPRNGDWDFPNVSVFANATVPDFFRMVPEVGGEYAPSIRYTNVFPADGPRMISVDVRIQDNHSRVQLNMDSPASSGPTGAVAAIFELSNGTIIDQTESASIESLEEGWYRISVWSSTDPDPGSGADSDTFLLSMVAPNAAQATFSGEVNHTWDGTERMQFRRPQAEASTVATPYQEVTDGSEFPASKAELTSEQIARADADSALAGDITTLTGRVGDAEGEIDTLQAVKVTASGAVSAVEQTISATYSDMEALASATSFAEATSDRISSGIIWRLNGANVLEAVSVQEGADSGPTVTGKLAFDYLQITSPRSAINSDPFFEDPYFVQATTENGSLSKISGGTNAPTQTSILEAVGFVQVYWDQRVYNINRDKNYLFRWVVKANSGSDDPLFSGVIKFVDGNGSLITDGPDLGWVTNSSLGNYYYPRQAALTGPWETYEASFGPDETRGIPSNAAGFYLGALLNQNGSASDRSLIVSAEVIEKSDAKLLVDGSIITDKLVASAVTADKIDVSDLVSSNAFIDNLEVRDANITGTLNANRLNLDGLSLTNSGGQLVVKDGGIVTDKVAGNAITSGGASDGSDISFTGEAGATIVIWATGTDSEATGGSTLTVSLNGSSVASLGLGNQATGTVIGSVSAVSGTNTISANMSGGGGTVNHLAAIQLKR